MLLKKDMMHVGRRQQQLLGANWCEPFPYGSVVDEPRKYREEALVLELAALRVQSLVRKWQAVSGPGSPRHEQQVTWRREVTIQTAAASQLAQSGGKGLLTRYVYSGALKMRL